MVTDGIQDDFCGMGDRLSHAFRRRFYFRPIAQGQHD
jgi:hypothetical protein